MTREELEAVIQLEYPHAYVQQWGHYASIRGIYNGNGYFIASGLSPEDAIKNLADRYIHGVRTK